MTGSGAASALCAPTERSVQRAILSMCGTCFRDVFIHHSPNGTKLAGSKRDRQVAGGILKGDGCKAGFPDLMFIWRGGMAFLEIKRPGGRLSPEQRAMHATLRNLGWPVDTVTSDLAAYRFLRECGAPCSAVIARVA